jgi:hypothetical protein
MMYIFLLYFWKLPDLGGDKKEEEGNLNKKIFYAALKII